MQCRGRCPHRPEMPQHMNVGVGLVSTQKGKISKKGRRGGLLLQRKNEKGEPTWNTKKLNN